MRDRDVRRALLALLEEQHRGDGDTSVVEEMGIWSGTVRIDVAVINGELTGFELKSERDTLARLPDQAEIYGLVFDRLYLVTTEKHLRKAKDIIPRWWGALIVRTAIDGTLEIRERRAARSNPGIDALILARLLWREEALRLLEEHDLASGIRSKPVGRMHERLATELDLMSLRLGVRSALKQRSNWLRQIDANSLDVPVHA
ncbi:sce7726 family protein [Sphingomonas sp. ASY06-1R]|uniref:sce7726 family protein n=1 Tax=Sphingomonas sp. ASY06-1R TaxID=3445771 RepID=UPI003FA2EFEA